MPRPSLVITALLPTLITQPVSSASSSGRTLPKPVEKFGGKIETKATESTPDWPTPATAPAGAPNVAIFMLDDVGYAASSTFGGPVNMPTLQALADSGLRYTRFHTTALSSPTRAALLAGRNHHAVHTGVIMEQALGYPGYDSLMGKDTATIGEILKLNGFSTAWFGKNHNVPDWQTSQLGPFDLWPTELGFEHFYGFVCADSNQWRPPVYEGTSPIEPYVGNPDYNFDYDIADQAIKWVQMQKTMAPTKPFLLYYVPGATHAPHHPKKEWIEKYKGKFDSGYNVVREEIFARQKQLGVIPQDTALTPTPDSIPAWETLSPQQKEVYARMMEVYAAYLEQTDYNIGRVIEGIRQMGVLDNTLIIYIVGDNGASPEGSLQGVLNELVTLNGLAENLDTVLARKDDLGTTLTYNHYPVGWCHAMCTPFQWTKQVASHFGGTRNAMVMSWPARIKSAGQVRSQFHHVIDIAPTILEATGVREPTKVHGIKQRKMDGVSMAYTWDDAASASTRRTQYFEMFGNRAIYEDGWVAATTPPNAPWIMKEAVDVIDGYKWELYNIDADYSQSNDLAASNPDKLNHLLKVFDREAKKNNVYPLNNVRLASLDPSTRPSLIAGRNTVVYYDGMTRLPEASVPDVKNKSWSLTAQVDIRDAKDSGIVITQGGLFAGWALYIKDGVPVFYYNTLGLTHMELAGQPLAAGKHTIDFRFDYDGGGSGKGGQGTLLVDSAQVAQGRIVGTVPVRFAFDEGLDVGEDTGTPVNLQYDVPFNFTGGIEQVTLSVGADNLSAADKAKLARLRFEASVGQ